jgi:hypothetical protein
MEAKNITNIPRSIESDRVSNYVVGEESVSLIMHDEEFNDM